MTCTHNGTKDTCKNKTIQIAFEIAGNTGKATCDLENQKLCLVYEEARNG